MSKLIAVTDTPSIKGYVFGTDNLIEIRGASYLLDLLNRKETPEHLKSCHPVFANGGSGQFIFSGISRDEGLRQLDGLVRLYRERTAGGASLYYGLAELSEDYPGSVTAAYRDLNARREGQLLLEQPTTFPLAKECTSCSQRPAVRYFQASGEWLCAVCLAKRKAARDAVRRGVWKEFADERPVDRPPTIDHIGHDVAVVFADGNQMGRTFRGLRDPESYSQYSTTIDNAVRCACFEALRAVFPDSLELPADILLLGGDDLVVVIRAEEALAFASSLAQRFEGLTADIGPLSLSVGVAIGKAKQPFRAMLACAQELLNLAKRRGAQIGTGDCPSMIDFHMMTSSSAVDIEDLRETEYKVRGPHNVEYRRTRRPYRISELETLFRARETLFSRGYPKGRLEAIYEAVFAPTSAQASLRMIEVFASGRPETRFVLADALSEIGCYEEMPWSTTQDGKDTGLAELIECYDFLKKPSGAGGVVNDRPS